RSNDPLHGAFLERTVAGNSSGESLSTENAGKKANGGAGILCVEGAPTAFQAAQAVAGDLDGGAVQGDVRAERFHAAESAVAIAGGGEIAQFAGAIGQSGEHGVAVRNGLVAGRFDTTRKGFNG